MRVMMHQEGLRGVQRDEEVPCMLGANPDEEVQGNSVASSTSLSLGKIAAATGLLFVLGAVVLASGPFRAEVSRQPAVASKDVVVLSDSLKAHHATENATKNSTKSDGNHTTNHTGNHSANHTSNLTASATAHKAAEEEEKHPKNCHTARLGEPCYDAVMWHKWIGVVENPTWYTTISRESNRYAIQKYLSESKQGSCPMPCEGEAYSLPPPKPKGSPSIYCFSVARPGPEMDTMYMQHQAGAGIFGCDGQAVYSDTAVDINGFKTTLISSTASGVSVDHTAANSQVFMRTWMTLLHSDQWYNFDFIAKVDPDAVFFADRIRGHLQWHTGQDVFFLNCAKYTPATMYGALEVFSKAALGAYLSQHKRCEATLPFWSWGEDRYMANCLESLGVHTQPDYLNFLHDERCWGVDCGNKAAVAFHAFKSVNSWYRCYLASK